MAEKLKQLLLHVKNPEGTQRRKKSYNEHVQYRGFTVLMGSAIKNQNASEFIFSVSVGVGLVLMKCARNILSLK